MQVIRPNNVTPDALTSSNVPIDDYPVWSSSSAPYSQGARVVSGIEAYESLRDDNRDTIAAGVAKSTPSWLRLGFVNRWRMFRDGRDSKTRQDGGIVAEIAPGVVTNGIALLGMEGLEVRVTMDDPQDGIVYDRTFTITDIGVTNYWDYFFLPYQVRSDFVALDLPPYDAATIRIEVITATQNDESAAGRIALGIVRTLGITDHDTSIQWINYSEFNRNPFGALEIIPRRRIKLVTYPITVEKQNSDFVINELDQLINETSVFVGSEDIGGTVTFGLPRRPRVTFSNPAITDMTIEVEEL